MRKIILILMLSPLLVTAQKTDLLLKLMDTKGVQIKGEATLKGFEKWINVITVSSGGKNNTQLTFTVPVGGAAADLKRAMASRELLLTGQVTALSSYQGGGTPAISYSIKMESMEVLSCSESMGCNNIMTTTVTLQATRIGWTYYNTAVSGVQSVSRKFGWDTSTNSEWNGF